MIDKVNQIHLFPATSIINEKVIKLKNGILSEDELDTIQYNFTLIQNALALKDIRNP